MYYQNLAKILNLIYKATLRVWCGNGHDGILEILYLFYYCIFTACDERFLEKIEISPIRGPRYYWSPGPIKLSCFASGDVQSIFWKRKRSDGAEQVVQSTELIEITDVSNDNIPSKNATVVNYLLTDKFPYVYHCVAIGKCCNEEKSDPTIVKLSPCRFPTGKSI